MNEMICVYLVPHQDDEVTNYGAAIVRDLAAGRRVRAVLCTDGGASGVRRMLENGKSCALHPEPHRYPLSYDAFTAARDREFLLSCQRLGIPAEDAVISPLRQRDGSLTPDGAAAILRAELARFPSAKVAVRSLSAIGGQNPDHRAVALAAASLFGAGAFPALLRLWELILLDAVPADAAPLRKLTPDAEGRRRLLHAADAYRIWDPENGFFAIGEHSVADEFADFRADPAGWAENALAIPGFKW